MPEKSVKKKRRWEQRYRELDVELAACGVKADIRNKILRRVHRLLDSSHLYGTETIAASAGASLERVISGRGGP